MRLDGNPSSQGAEEIELTNLQLKGLVRYFGIDSAETSGSLVEGIDALVTLQRS